jgi:hypothetical protein
VLRSGGCLWMHTVTRKLSVSFAFCFRAPLQYPVLSDVDSAPQSTRHTTCTLFQSLDIPEMCLPQFPCANETLLEWIRGWCSLVWASIRALAATPIRNQGTDKLDDKRTLPQTVDTVDGSGDQAGSTIRSCRQASAPAEACPIMARRAVRECSTAGIGVWRPHTASRGTQPHSTAQNCTGL